MEASALYRKHAISTSERGSLIRPRKQATAWQLASASFEAPLANGERSAPRRCSLNSTYNKNCGSNRAHLLRLMKVFGEMNNSTLKIRRGKSYLLNFSKICFSCISFEIILCICHLFAIPSCCSLCLEAFCYLTYLKKPKSLFSKWDIHPPKRTARFSSILGLSNVSTCMCLPGH